MLCNDPALFRDEMLKGYVAAYPGYVMEAPGGVVSARETPASKVAVMNGGGSGHYPAFCGIVGDGLMDGCVVGNVFTSPSCEDVLGVAGALRTQAGLMILGGNYAGDKMNFDMARDRLRAQGIDARTFYITDDVSAAPPEQAPLRRGNVGTFLVFKAAGAAAAAGLSLDEVERVAIKANDRTRTMSIGLRGCTLPGHTKPLFEVPSGLMEVGQGIHGESGVAEKPVASAQEIASLLVERVLSEAPGDARRLAVVLDGLGSTKYEELFVVWGTVSQLLAKAGYELVEPVVGEVVTSLDMEGIALAVQYLDEELERLWCAPCASPGFSRGPQAAPAKLRERSQAAHSGDGAERIWAPAGPAAQAQGRVAARALAAMAACMADQEEMLAQIDSVCGDGDHGRGMVRGSKAAAAVAQDAVEAQAGVGSVLQAAGDSWRAAAGGTSGVLWGSALWTLGETLGDEQEVIDAALMAQATDAACAKLMELGGAQVGDKTMVDALVPFAEALGQGAEAGLSLSEAWGKAVTVAHEAARNTANLTAKIGRARPQASRSLGTPDAGAISLALCLEACGLGCPQKAQ